MSLSDLARATDPERIAIKGAIRRMAVSLTRSMLWQLAGFKQLDGSTETFEAEPFAGVGVYARPPSGAKAEAIVVMVGGGKSPAIIATRDEKTRAAVAAGIKEDETMIYTSQACVLIKANGTIEIRSASGTALPLATKADIDALKTWAATHTHQYLPGPGAATPTATPLPAPPAAVGTTKLKAE